MQGPRAVSAGRDARLQSVAFDLMSHEMLEYFIEQPTPPEKKSNIRCNPILPVEEAIENFGFQCGQKILLLTSLTHRVLFKESIDYIKHIAIEVWPFIFRTNIDKVKTEYGGRHDLYIQRFDWISVLSNQDMASKEYQDKIALYLSYICGILRGALATMGLDSQVNAEQKPDCYVFSINLNKHA